MSPILLKENLPLVVDRDLRHVVDFKDPHLVLVDGWLTQSECDHLLHTYSEALGPTGFYNIEGQVTESDRRKARSCWIKDPIVTQMQERFELLMGWPRVMMEGCNLVAYERGDYIVPHHDYFGDINRPKQEYQRLATALVFLDTCNGVTHLDELGITVSARAGSLLFFSYPESDARLKHSSPPLNDDAKHVLVQWFTDRPLWNDNE